MLHGWPPITPARCRSSISAARPWFCSGTCWAVRGPPMTCPLTGPWHRLDPPSATEHLRLRPRRPPAFAGGAEQFALSENSPRIKCSRGVVSFGLRRAISASCRAPAGCCSATPTGPTRAMTSSAGSRRGPRIPNGARPWGGDGRMASRHRCCAAHEPAPLRESPPIQEAGDLRFAQIAPLPRAQCAEFDIDDAHALQMLTR